MSIKSNFPGGGKKIKGTAIPAHVLVPNTFMSEVSKDVQEGTMPDIGAVLQALNAGGSYTIPAGYHNGEGKVTANSLASQTAADAAAADIVSPKTAWVNGVVVTGSMPTVEQATPVISVDANGLITASAAQAAGKVAAGTKSAAKQLAVQAAKTVTPGTADQTAVAAGTYATGAVVVTGDADLVAANIVKGKQIFGVDGSHVPQGDATPADVVSGKTFQSAASEGLQTGTLTGGGLIKFKSGSGTLSAAGDTIDLGFYPTYLYILAGINNNGYDALLHTSRYHWFWGVTTGWGTVVLFSYAKTSTGFTIKSTKTTLLGESYDYGAGKSYVYQAIGY